MSNDRIIVNAKQMEGSGRAQFEMLSRETTKMLSRLCVPQPSGSYQRYRLIDLLGFLALKIYILKVWIMTPYSLTNLLLHLQGRDMRHVVLVGNTKAIRPVGMMKPIQKLGWQ
jgi:hypothetical protein